MGERRVGRVRVATHVGIILGWAGLMLLVGCAEHEVGRGSGFRWPFRKNTLRVRNPIVTSPDYWIQKDVQPEEEFPGPTPQDLKPPEGDYIVGAGDRLIVSVFELMAPGVPTELDVRGSEQGQVTLPYLGTVKVLGLTTRGIEEKLKDILFPDYLKDPQVRIFVAEYRNRLVTLISGTMRPGVYPLLRHDVTLLEVLASAGGVLQAAEPYGYVIRFYKPEEADILMLESGKGAEGGEKPEPEPGDKEPEAEPEVEEAPESRDSDIEELKALAEGESAKGARPPEDKPVKAVTEKPEKEKIEDLSRWMWVDGKWVEVPARPGKAPETAVAEKPPVKPAAEKPETPLPPESELERKLRRLGVIAGGAELKRIIRIDMDALQAGDPTQNIVLRNGDIINIPLPAAGEFYMDGHVVRKGVYSLTGRKITVLQAIAAAGGLDQVAVPWRTELVRRISDGEEEIIYLDLNKIACGEAPDIYLQPDDLIRVGTDQKAIFDAVIRNAFRATYGVGAVYDMNFADFYPWSRNINPLFSY
ncbi:MAG: polysaccharide biosynthesis/export family protein [Planctomycetia bacterium]|nr:polysaccharide biosynthesis/export family protein [Planctomycetia bacterium]